MSRPGKRNSLRLGTIIAALMLALTVQAQFPKIKFDRRDINNGLSQNHIMCILQDSRGFMWFGTRDGLNKYDGYRFTVYKNVLTDSTTISNNFISALAEDSDGYIWVATRGGGLSRYDRNADNFRQYKYNDALTNTVPTDLLTDLIVDRNNKVWLSSEDGGLSSLDPKTGKFSFFRNKPNDSLSLGYDNTRCVLQDAGGLIWVGSYGGGLSVYDPGTGKFTTYRHSPADPGTLSNDNVVRLFMDSHRRIWVGTAGGGLNLFNPSTATFSRFAHREDDPSTIGGNVVFAINEDETGNIWVGSENAGVTIFDPRTGKMRHYINDEIDRSSLSNNSVYAIYKDRNGSMWVGTFAGGLNIYDKSASKFLHYKHTADKNSLSHNNVLAMATSANGKIWIGTDGGGLNLYDPVNGSFRHYQHQKGNRQTIAGNYVLSVLEDSRGRVWVGTWGSGVTVFDPAKNTYQHYTSDQKNPRTLTSDNAWVIYEDKKGIIWIGTYNGGLTRFDEATNDFTRFDDKQNNTSTRKIHAIAEDQLNNLWIATDGGGLQVFNKATGQFAGYTHIKGGNSLSDNRVTNIYRDKKGNFWISTMAGLNYLDVSTRLFTHYTTQDGLPNNVIFGVMEDRSGRLWISTNHGLSRFSPATKKFKNFGIRDGLQSYEFKMRAFCQSRDGTMYFGGIEGFNQFNPDNITQDVKDHPMVLTGFQIFNKEVPISRHGHKSPLQVAISETKEITIGYNKSVISFEFASLNYTPSANKQYAYKLEGFDEEWNVVGSQRMATYTNLDPGKYTFMVKALNEDGRWSANIASISLIVTPPFWLTWWFRISFLFLVAGSIAAFYLARLNNVKRQRELLKVQVNERTTELLHSQVQEHHARLEAEAAREDAHRANEELASKNKELEQFVYIASHDLREPLRTTTSFIQLFQRQYTSVLDQRGLQYLGYIAQAAERMRTLIDDLLEYSKIGGHGDLREVECSKVMQEVLDDLGIAIKESGARVNVGTLPVIYAHRTAVKQLFQNLLANGIKFRRKDVTPEINIWSTRKNGVWEFYISDNGIGIAPQYREKIFVIFQRLHNRKEYEGSGIGLAHCKKIVELHKGRIWVESEPGEGTTFHFTLQQGQD